MMSWVNCFDLICCFTIGQESSAKSSHGLIFSAQANNKNGIQNEKVSTNITNTAPPTNKPRELFPKILRRSPMLSLRTRLRKLWRMLTRL